MKLNAQPNLLRRDRPRVRGNARGPGEVLVSFDENKESVGGDEAGGHHIGGEVRTREQVKSVRGVADGTEVVSKGELFQTAAGVETNAWTLQYWFELRSNGADSVNDGVCTQVHAWMCVLIELDRRCTS